MLSPEQMAAVRASYDAIWIEGDVEAGLALVAEDVEWITPQNPEGPIRRGREEVATFFREFLETFETIEVEYEFEQTADGRVVVTGNYRGRSRGSGIEIETPLGQIWTVKEGRAVRMEWFATGQKAREAAGLGS